MGEDFEMFTHFLLEKKVVSANGLGARWFGARLIRDTRQITIPFGKQKWYSKIIAIKLPRSPQRFWFSKGPPQKDRNSGLGVL